MVDRPHPNIPPHHTCSNTSPTQFLYFFPQNKRTAGPQRLFSSPSLSLSRQENVVGLSPLPAAGKCACRARAFTQLRPVCRKLKMCMSPCCIFSPRRQRRDGKTRNNLNESLNNTPPH